jgi:hypothetical protein
VIHYILSEKEIERRILESSSKNKRIILLSGKKESELINKLYNKFDIQHIKINYYTEPNIYFRKKIIVIEKSECIDDDIYKIFLERFLFQLEKNDKELFFLNLEYYYTCYLENLESTSDIYYLTI